MRNSNNGASETWIHALPSILTAAVISYWDHFLLVSLFSRLLLESTLYFAPGQPFQNIYSVVYNFSLASHCISLIFKFLIIIYKILHDPVLLFELTFCHSLYTYHIHMWLLLNSVFPWGSALTIPSSWHFLFPCKTLLPLLSTSTFSNCYGLNGIPPKLLCWSPNLQLWYLEIGLLRVT